MLEGLERIELEELKLVKEKYDIVIKDYSKQLVINKELEVKNDVLNEQAIDFETKYSSYLKDLEKVARADPLTGIYNRRFFMELASNSLIRSERSKENCFIIMFDLDKFKLINDTYGHHIGDKVLIETTSRIKKTVRPYDFFARYGGEEFIILLVNSQVSEIYNIVERLRMTIGDYKYKIDDLELQITASFGVAATSEYNLDLGIKRADEALYEAKETGRNKTIIYEAKRGE